MKNPTSPHAVALLLFGLIAPLSAQNLDSNLSLTDSLSATEANKVRFSEISALNGSFEVPSIERAQGELPDEPSVFAAQDSLTLDAKANTSVKVESVVDLDILRSPSSYRKILVSAKGSRYEISTDSLQKGLEQISAAYRESGKPAQSSDCSAIAMSIEQQVKLDSSRTLEIVEREIGANPGCACEIVKTAIKASDADKNQVVAIVEAAILVSPESMRIVSQCAIATMPESIAGVQALLAKLDPNAGDSGSSSKSAKSAKVASIVSPIVSNPLDLPPLGPPLPPPPITPPPVSDVNPCKSWEY